MNWNKLFKKLPDNRFFRLLSCLIDRYLEHGVSRTAAALTYYFLFSVFPLLVLVSAILSRWPVTELFFSLDLHRILPANVIELAVGFLENFSTIPFNYSFFWTSIVFLIYLPMRAAMHLIKSICIAYGDNSISTSFFRRLFAVFLFTLSLPILMLVSIISLLVGRNLLVFLSRILPINLDQIGLWTTLRFFFLGFLLFLLLCLLYYICAHNHYHLREIFPGALLALLLWLIISRLFTFYVENMGKYSLLYGSLGAIIVLLLWLYFTTLLLVMGAEFNMALIDSK